MAAGGGGRRPSRRARRARGAGRPPRGHGRRRIPPLSGDGESEDTPLVAAVTGSSGFIGGRLVRALLERGFRVRCLVRGASVPPPEAIGSGVERHVIDYGDARSLATTPALDGVTHVFHLAGVTRARSLADFRRGNVLPTESLLGALNQRREPTLRRVVHVSSLAAAGPAAAADQPVDEAATPAPIEAYGRSKAEAEGAIQRYATSLPCTIVRPPAVYGPGDADFLALFRMLRWRLSLHPGRRDGYLSLIYVDDLVEGMIAAALSPAAAGGTYFLAPPRPERWSEIHRLAAAVSGRRPLEIDVPRIVLTAGGRAGDLLGRLTGRAPLLTSQKVALSGPRYWVCSSERARRAFDFRAPTPLEDGLRTTHGWYRENGWLP